MGTESSRSGSHCSEPVIAIGLPLMSGILVVDKPLGVTSRDCVNRVERLLRELFPKPAKLPKVGHAGTLDPLATGVLVIGIGLGVRLVPYIQSMPKTYAATFRLGCFSQTGDLEGELEHDDSPVVPTRETIESVSSQMIGEITQTPPATSAVRVDGKQAYKYAHQGQAVVVPSRLVRIDSIEITRYEYPEIDLVIQCGSGTYIRTLGMDLAEQCGTHAVMSRLRRTAIGCFSLQRSVTIASLAASTLESQLLPLREGAESLTRLTLPAELITRVSHGIKIPVSTAEPCEAEEVAVVDSEGNLRAILRREGELWGPYRVFHQATR